MRLLTFFLLIHLFCLNLSLGQEQPIHPATLYIDSTGQVYTRADQPAYFFITPSDNPGELTAVPSSDRDANPMFWDGHGVHYVVHKDSKINKPVRFKIFADGIPPESKFTFTSGVIFNFDNKYYIDKDAQLEIDASDGMTGVATKWISVNNKPYTQAKESLTFPTTGEFVVKAYSVDAVGNAETPKEIKVFHTTNGVIQMDNIYFDLNSAKLRSDALAEVDNLAKLMKNYPNIHIEMSAHTDSRGESEYNMELSIARAQAVVSYIQGKGISKERLSAKGFGDTMPVNECKKGVVCTEQQHKQNRRVELRIVNIANN